MTPAELERLDAELTPLVPRKEASAVAREHAAAFNESVSEVRTLLLDPARELLERGVTLGDVCACLEKAVAELAFWRTVLVGFDEGAFGPAPSSSGFLLGYLTSPDCEGEEARGGQTRRVLRGEREGAGPERRSGAPAAIEADGGRA